MWTEYDVTLSCRAGKPSVRIFKKKKKKSMKGSLWVELVHSKP